MKWSNWSSVSQGTSTPGAPITALAFDGRIVVFLADPGGGVYFATGHPEGNWSGWTLIPNRLTTPGARIAAFPVGGKRIALFVTAASGEVFSVTGSPDSVWGDWRSAAQGSSPPGSPLCAVPDGDCIALFLADPHGEVYSTAGYPDRPAWEGLWNPVSEGSTTPGAPVTSIPYGSGFAVFLADPHGGVYFTNGRPETTWGNWRPADGVSTTPGAPVCAVRFGDRIALFLANGQGEVFCTAGSPESPIWGGTWASVSEGSTTPGAPVTAVPYDGGFAVFLADPNGGVYFATGKPEGNWSGWSLVDGLRTTPGAHVAVANIGTRLALFVTDQKGEVFSTATVPLLRKAEIKFDTHNTANPHFSVVHVFVKNRLNNSLSPEENSDLVTNQLALQAYQNPDDPKRGGQNPYLAFGTQLSLFALNQQPSSLTFPLNLVSDGITVDDVVLPQVDIHMLSSGSDRWVFDYTVTLTFDNGTLSFSSTADGVQGIILDEENRNYSGIGTENPLRILPIPVPAKAAIGAVLNKVTLEFATHGSDSNEHDDKDHDTVLNVHIVNRVNAQAVQDLVIATDISRGQRFPDSGPPEARYQQFNWSADRNTLASNSIQLAVMVLPMIYLIIVPVGNDRWIFDYQVTLEFVDPDNYNHKPQIYTWRKDGVTLDQETNKHVGVYQGPPFPTVAPPTAPGLIPAPINHTGEGRKMISIPLFRRKLTEIINNRNDPGGTPLFRMRLGAVVLDPNNARPLPESYVDLQKLVNGGDGATHYISNPSSLGQMTAAWGFGNSYLQNIDSASMTVEIDPSLPAPIALTVAFQKGGFVQTTGPGVGTLEDRISLDGLSIRLNLTLGLWTTAPNRFAKTFTVVDLMAWVPQLQDLLKTATFVKAGEFTVPHYKGMFLGQPVDTMDDISSTLLEKVIYVDLPNDSPTDPRWKIRHTIRDKIYEKLTTIDVITRKTMRDSMNAFVTSWLLGGAADDARNTDENNATIHSIGVLNQNPELGIEEDSIAIDYSGPTQVFQPQAPEDWPTGRHTNTEYDFSPSTLANIHHIVVLTKENRSFDHMLGYLSLPVDMGGLGRQDVDGLKGGEFNPYQGRNYPSFALSETRFAPGPPNDYEAVHQAINFGRMDGHVKSHAELNGDEVAGQVMGHHTGATVPVYDALARDFAIGHRWFASHPGPTFPNRFYELTGRPNLDPRGFWEFENSSPKRPVFTDTIFDHLTGAIDPVLGTPVTWRHYEHGYCTLRYFERYTFDEKNIVDFEDPVNGFLATAKAGTLPSVSFIDPHFVDLPSGSNCDEPPSDVADGQEMVQRVVDAVVSGPAWNNTLLLIVYDEPGGFYDHVPPPAAVPVSPKFPVNTLGPRVPALVISPWVKPGSVFGNGIHFDHTSILKTIARRFLSDKPPYMGARYAAANDLSSVLSAQPHTPQFLPFIRHRLQCVASGWMLDVKEANPAPGTPLWQFSPNLTNAQDYCFEEQDDGFLYIRSHVSHLYVTVQIVDPAFPASVRVVQDIKYPSSSGTGTPPVQNQRWKLAPAEDDQRGGTLVQIWSEAYPSLRLLPRDPTAFQSEMTLVDPASVGGELRWRVLEHLVQR